MKDERDRKKEALLEIGKKVFGELSALGLAKAEKIGDIVYYRLDDLKDEDCDLFQAAKPKRSGESMRLAQRLAEILSWKYGTASGKKLFGWAQEIQRMHDLDGIALEEMGRMLDWYDAHGSEQYVPQVSCAKHFRNAWAKLIDARNRTGTMPAKRGESKRTINEHGVTVVTWADGKKSFFHPKTGQSCSETGTVL